MKELSPPVDKTTAPVIPLPIRGVQVESRTFPRSEAHMADRWVIAYDVDTDAVEQARSVGGVTLMTVYNRIRRSLSGNGFDEFTQLSVYAMADTDNALVRVYQAIQALSQLAERVFIKRLHVFKIDGALNDVLPLVDQRDSAPATGAETGIAAE
jgi:virulence-associated protein VapD